MQPYLSILHEEFDRILEQIELSSIFLSMRKKIEHAIQDKIITKGESEYVVDKLNKIESDGEFKKEWNILRKKWGKWFYPSMRRSIEFSSEFIDFLGGIIKSIGSINKRSKNKLERFKRISFEGIEEINSFLKKYEIDGVRNGYPLIDIYNYKCKVHEDNAGRCIVQLEIPITKNIEEFRKIATKGYSRMRKYIFWANGELHKVLKARWGEKSGKREYLRKRNERIIKEYKKLKKLGSSDEDIRPDIYSNLKLGKDMKSWDSVKPVIDKYKKRLKSKK